MDILLVDGYNVLHSVYQELLAELGHARDKFAADLAEYAAFEGLQAILVFDAHSVVGAADRSELLVEGLEIVYTSEGETADSFIEKLAYRLVRQGERVFVVTSDRMEQTVALGTGAYRITARELGIRVKQTKQKLRDETQAATRRDRRELASHLSEDVAARLDKLRHKR
ncbi:MAG: yacP [Anaerosporomusa subterranea]|jgi:predicted RNA-binding protein with PIN domain|nr:yacP [Anaerosporomusa subterranea]